MQKTYTPHAKWSAGYLVYSWSIVKFPPCRRVPVPIVLPKSQWSRQSGPSSNPWQNVLDKDCSLTWMTQFTAWVMSLVTLLLTFPFSEFVAVFLFLFEPKLNSSPLSAQINCPNIMKTWVKCRCASSTTGRCENPPIWRLLMAWQW